MSDLNRPDFDAIMLPAGEQPFLHLCWLLHNKCNHKCSYCAEINWGGSFQDLQLDSCKRFVVQARQHFRDRKLMVSFTGGEPTLWPDFAELVRWLKVEIGAVLLMTTNGTRLPAYFAEIAQYFDWMSFSYHPEFTKDDRFIENIQACAGISNLTVRVMFPPSPALFEKSKRFLANFNDLHDRGKLKGFIKVESVPIAVGFGTEFTSPAKYNSDQEDFLQKSVAEFNSEEIAKIAQMPISQLRAYRADSPGVTHWFEPNDLVAKEKANFFGWKCDIGLEQLFIDHTGTVVRAGCRVGSEVGKLSQGVFNFPTTAVYCPKKYCHCITDILTTKRSPQWLKEVEAEAEAVPKSARLLNRLSSFKYAIMTKLTLLEAQSAQDLFERSWLNTKFISTSIYDRKISYWVFQQLIVFAKWYFRVRVFLVKVLVRIFYARVFWKPYYFLRHQYRKRILKVL